MVFDHIIQPNIPLFLNFNPKHEMEAQLYSQVPLGSAFVPPSPIAEPAYCKEDVNRMVEWDSGSRPCIRSPISFFPKPLALSYVGFNNHYAGYTYANGERMEVASSLVSALLASYFPKPKFSMERLPSQSVSLIQTVKVEGTIYWMVTVEEDDKAKVALADDGAHFVESPGEGLRADAVFSGRQRPACSSIVVLVAIVTERHFQERAERSTPTKLHFSDSIKTASGSVIVGEEEFSRGHVVIVSGKTNPVRPSVEFYTFDAASDEESLHPWFGQLASHPAGLVTNIFSFATEDAQKVDQMFTAIVSCSFKDCALTPKLPDPSPAAVSTLQGTIATSVLSRSATHAILAQVTANMTEQEIFEYLRTLKMNKAGRIINGWTGQLLRKEKEKEAKQLAHARSFTIALPKGRIRSR